LRARPPPRTITNVILVTLDGVRVQELFAGMDATIAADDARSGAEDIEVTAEALLARNAQGASRRADAMVLDDTGTVRNGPR
jgi:hypothetical protein